MRVFVSEVPMYTSAYGHDRFIQSCIVTARRPGKYLHEKEIERRKKEGGQDRLLKSGLEVGTEL